MGILQKSITKIIAFTLLVSVLFVMTLPTSSVLAEVGGSGKAVTIVNKESYDTMQDAIAAAVNGDTIEINKDISIEMGTSANGGILVIKNKELTIEGNGHTITGVRTGSSDGMGNMIIVYNGSRVNIKNLTVDGNNKAAKHGIQVNTDPSSATKTTAEAVLYNVTAKNCLGYGVMVNGALLEAAKLTTQGNGWGGVNVSQGNKVTVIPKFTLYSGILKEDVKIKIDNSAQQPANEISSAWVVFDGDEKDGWRYSVSADNKEIFFQQGAEITGVALNTAGVSIKAGSSEQLIANVLPLKAYDKNVTWSSSDTNIAGVTQKGMVTAKNPGVTTVTAIAGDNKTKSECIVTVTANVDNTPPVTKIEPRIESTSDTSIVYFNTADIEEALTNAAVGANIVIEAPDCAKAPIVSKEVFEAASHSNAEKITITTKGEGDTYAATFAFNTHSINDTNISVDTGIFKTPTSDISSSIDSSIPSGAAIIPITLAHEGNFPGPVDITIPVDLSPGAVVFIYYVHKGGSVDGSKDILELVNKQEILVSDSGTITFTLEHASDYVISTAAKVDSGNTPDPGNTPAPGNNPGKTSIAPKSIKLNKNSVSVTMGKTKILKATLNPKGSMSKIKWVSSNTKVAKVNSKGKITGLAPGKATITAKTGSKLKAKCKVTVKPKAPTFKVTTVNRTATIKWNKVKKVSGYKVYRAKSKDGKFIMIRNAAETSTFNKSSNMISGKTYYYKMRAYTKVKGETIYSNYSEIVKIKVK